MGDCLQERISLDALSVSRVNRPHLSCIDDPSKEFQAPDGTWLLVARAIVYDGWLVWNDALPDEPVLRSKLNRASFEGIEALARRIHVVHQLMPNYRSLTRSPFTVRRWWDPDDEDPLWSAGRACLLKLDGYSSKEFERATPAKCRLTVRCVTDQWVEFSLPEHEVITAAAPAAVSNKSRRAATSAARTQSRLT